MTCSHCCDANKIFDLKSAKKELEAYQKKGPQGTTKKLLSASTQITKQGKTLLDIGGGIGVLQWEFLKEGATSTTDIDASDGYIEVATDYAKEQGWQESAHFKMADFNDVAKEIEAFDFVSLDKVVCCYPDYQLILQNALDKTKSYLLISYPMSNWGSRLVNLMGRVYFRIRKSEFRTYIHPVQEIESIIANAGFEVLHKGFTFPWLTRIYQRV